MSLWARVGAAHSRRFSWGAAELGGPAGRKGPATRGLRLGCPAVSSRRPPRLLGPSPHRWVGTGVGMWGRGVGAQGRARGRVWGRKGGHAPRRARGRERGRGGAWERARSRGDGRPLARPTAPFAHIPPCNTESQGRTPRQGRLGHGLPLCVGKRVTWVWVTSQKSPPGLLRQTGQCLP